MTKSKPQARWMTSMINEAKKSEVTLPWHRALRAAKRAAHSQGNARSAQA
ncbi:hypothetical protein [Celeribacter sp.]